MVASSSDIVVNSTTHKGTFLNALQVKSKDVTIWIVDLGASNHMTGNVSLLLKVRPCNKNLKIKIVNESLSTVANVGNVPIFDTLTLDSVLLVPNLSCNLL